MWMNQEWLEAEEGRHILSSIASHLPPRTATLCQTYAPPKVDLGGSHGHDKRHDGGSEGVQLQVILE